MEKGEIDACANSEPIGTLLLAQGIVRNVADQAKDAPYNDEYCCAVIANGSWLTANPEAGAAATRAMLKGAKWVNTNPRARRAPVGGKEISRVESRAEHHGHRQPQLHAERARRQSGGATPPRTR